MRMDKIVHPFSFKSPENMLKNKIMINKIFLVLFGAAFLIMALLTFMTSSQLKSIGFPPEQIVQNFVNYESVHWILFWISSGVLLIVGNIILWTEQKAWALWLTLLFFAVFIMTNTWWLTENLANYQIHHGLPTGGIFSKNGIFGAIFCIVGGIVIFFDQFLILRLRDKMFEKPGEEVESSPVGVEEESPTNETVDQ
jgi:hypothetical protein